MLRCRDGSYYTGITNDLERRIKQHNESKEGAKYTRTRRPVVLAYQEQHIGRSSALKREIEIKKLDAEKKRQLAANKKASRDD